MAHTLPESDNDSAYGGDDHLFWPDPMFALPAPLAGQKRDANEAILCDAKSIAPGLTHEAALWPGQLGPSAQGARDSPAACVSCTESRPSKRKASAGRVAEYHGTTAAAADQLAALADQQFPDTCFEEFCQGCDLDTAECNSPCALPCPDEGQCSEEDACWDPHCEEVTCIDPCAEPCADPECTKSSDSTDPCFCQKCDAQPCPLGDPNSECHFAHTAPTAVGTIYCYDDARCHFQEGQHGFDSQLSAYETYPCYSHSHEQLNQSYGTAHPSSVATPVLSPGNYTSIESAFSSHPSPTSNQNDGSHCYLNIPGDHCHIDNSCCHGDSRACGDCPTAPQEHLDVWNTSIAGANGFSNNFLNFSLQGGQVAPAFSHGPSNASMNVLENPLYGFNDTTWLLPQSHYTDAFQKNGPSSNPKLNFNMPAPPVQFIKTEPQLSLPTTSMPPIDSTITTSPTDPSHLPHVCKWQHSPGILCLAAFPDPSTLHAHIKSAHVDTCTTCTCQWAACTASSKDFKQRSKLSRHLLAHAGHRPYACTFAGCTKTFATNQAKDNHERTHTGERPYVCDRCGYTTTTHTQLQTHIQALHEGKKPHKCRFCDFSCADSSNLSKHERTHQTLRPYRCPHPHCTFKPDCRWENLKRHLRRSGHCPGLLVEGSDEARSYREAVRRETDEWNRRAAQGGEGVVVGAGGVGAGAGAAAGIVVRARGRRKASE